MCKDWGTAKPVCEHLLCGYGRMPPPTSLLSITGSHGLRANYVKFRLRCSLARSDSVRTQQWEERTKDNSRPHIYDTRYGLRSRMSLNAYSHQFFRSISLRTDRPHKLLYTQDAH